MTGRRRTTLFVASGLVVALGLAFFASQEASSQPDGLEKVAGDEGFLDTAEDHALVDGPLADYTTEGVADEGLSTGAAGVVGVLATFTIAGGLVLVATKLSRRRPEPRPA